ncbi:putative transposase IS66 (plasmid) [Sinorhizobium meliloti SM11]|uniref:Transposase IS66 n=1 Tax=Sinorhizobium meliloti (strain SM11) TaxID=707241 RepID=F7XC54_SINMM|nr:putative transposase IS66 [Sinorhizobium meliloti SM11]
MGKLWQVEETVRGASPETRVAVRQQTSAVVVAEFFALWHQTLPRISGKSKLAEAIRYAISRGAIFERFLTEGRIELDSNIVERATRTHSSSAATAAEGTGRPSRHCCKRQK